MNPSSVPIANLWLFIIVIQVSNFLPPNFILSSSFSELISHLFKIPLIPPLTSCLLFSSFSKIWISDKHFSNPTSLFLILMIFLNFLV